MSSRYLDLATLSTFPLVDVTGSRPSLWSLITLSHIILVLYAGNTFLVMIWKYASWSPPSGHVFSVARVIRDVRVHAMSLKPIVRTLNVAIVLCRFGT